MAVTIDGRRAFWAWWGAVRKRQSTPSVDYATQQLLQECGTTLYSRGWRDCMAASVQLRGAIDTLEEVAVLWRAWEIEREAVQIAGADVERSVGEHV
jgi:hypothetical protein